MNKKQLGFIAVVTFISYLVFCLFLTVLCGGTYSYFGFWELYRNVLKWIGLFAVGGVLALSAVLFFALALLKIYEFLGDKAE